MTPRRLDDLLADAAILQGEYDDEDTAASRRRIERDVADTWWRSAWRGESSAKSVAPWLTQGAACRRHGSVHQALHEEAARDLRRLSILVIRDPQAAQHIALLADSCRVEAASALVFACLLHLASEGEGAQFWWQFSAGAGSATAALCLYLMHMQRGELRDATHWAAQAICLERQENHLGTCEDCPPPPAYSSPWTALHHRPPSNQPPSPQASHWYTPQAMVTRALVALNTHITGASAIDDLISSGTLCCSLVAAVQRLETTSDADYGTIPLASHFLAAQLEDCTP